MNRRKFMSNVSVLSLSTFGLNLPLIGKNALINKYAGFKALCKTHNVKECNLSNDLKSHLDKLKGTLISSFNDRSYQYDGNYLVEVNVQNIIFNKPGLLFITSDGNHLLVQEKDLLEFDKFIKDFQIGNEQHGFRLNPVECVFPYQVKDNESAVFSFYNKCGNQVKLKKRGDNKRVYIY